MYVQLLSSLHIPSSLFPLHLFKVQPVWVLPWMHKDIWLSFCVLDWNAHGNPVERADCKAYSGPGLLHIEMH